MTSKEFFKKFVNAAMKFAKLIQEKVENGEQIPSSYVYGINKIINGKHISFLTNTYKEEIDVIIKGDKEFPITFSFAYFAEKEEFENLLKEVLKKKYIELQNQMNFIEDYISA